MAAKTTDWRPGPTVCRCCLSEGCYKDISTEYFWMGKREVYSEMLSETFSLAIAYSTSGGPNSNSRLICEPCISRLRDASDFKRQVQECEKTFMQYLDPGSEPLSDFDDTRVEVSVEQMQTQVKVEQVKTEKDDASEPEDFDDRADYLDDDDDDLDDQPLTRLATKVPKKESVDLLDLLDSTKTAEKRKSTTKVKAGPAKKAKTKKEVVKATSSKASKQTEKKKKGPEDTQQQKPNSPVNVKWKRKRRVGEDRANAALILQYSNAVPFRCNRGKFMCAYCPTNYLDMIDLRLHSAIHDKLEVLENPKFRILFPIRIDISDLACTICNEITPTLKDLVCHLSATHAKAMNQKYSDGVLPFVLTNKEYKCVLCGIMFERFLTLFVHMNSHYQSYICHTCGKGFTGKQKLRAHQTSHESGQFPCTKCDLVFINRAYRNRHTSVAHGPKERYRCPVCDAHFDSYHSRIRHLDRIHGQKVEYRCNMCPAIFGTCTLRYSHINVVHFQKRKRKKQLQVI